MGNHQLQPSVCGSFFEEVIPENVNEMVQNLNEYRKTLKGDFEAKVIQMNTITESLISKKE